MKMSISQRRIRVVRATAKQPVVNGNELLPRLESRCELREDTSWRFDISWQPWSGAHGSMRRLANVFATLAKRLLEFVRRWLGL